MHTMIESFAAIIARELRGLRRQIENYQNEADLWRMPPGAPNSAGTLTLHLCGNLRSYIGNTLGHSGYVRDRDKEFAQRDVPRDELLAQIADAESQVERTFASLTDDVFATPFPSPVGEWRLTTGDFLTHLVAHLAYHVGQIDYHRRLVTGDERGVDSMPLRELKSAQRSASN